MSAFRSMLTLVPPGDDEPGLRLIIGYKLARAVLALVAAAVLAIATATGHTEPLYRAALALRHHLSSAWSVRLANALIRAVVPQQLLLVVAALAFDGTFTFLEGWSLHRRWTWGPLLVVVTTLAFVPFEVMALVRRVDVERLVLLVANVLVAVYLARRALAKRRVSLESR